MYPEAKAEAIGKVRKSLTEIVNLMALRHNLTEKQRLMLRKEVVACLNKETK